MGYPKRALDIRHRPLDSRERPLDSRERPSDFRKRWDGVGWGIPTRVGLLLARVGLYRFVWARFLVIPYPYQSLLKATKEKSPYVFELLK